MHSPSLSGLRLNERAVQHTLEDPALIGLDDTNKHALLPSLLASWLKHGLCNIFLSALSLLQ